MERVLLSPFPSCMTSMKLVSFGPWISTRRRCTVNIVGAGVSGCDLRPSVGKSQNRKARSDIVPANRSVLIGENKVE